MVQQPGCTKNAVLSIWMSSTFPRRSEKKIGLAGFGGLIPGLKAMLEWDWSSTFAECLGVKGRNDLEFLDLTCQMVEVALWISKWCWAAGPQKEKYSFSTTFSRECLFCFSVVSKLMISDNPANRWNPTIATAGCCPTNWRSHVTSLHVEIMPNSASLHLFFPFFWGYSIPSSMYFGGGLNKKNISTYMYKYTHMFDVKWPLCHDAVVLLPFQIKIPMWAVGSRILVLTSLIHLQVFSPTATMIPNFEMFFFGIFEWINPKDAPKHISICWRLWNMFIFVFPLTRNIVTIFWVPTPKLTASAKGGRGSLLRERAALWTVWCCWAPCRWALISSGRDIRKRRNRRAGEGGRSVLEAELLNHQRVQITECTVQGECSAKTYVYVFLKGRTNVPRILPPYNSHKWFTACFTPGILPIFLWDCSLKENP